MCVWGRRALPALSLGGHLIQKNQVVTLTRDVLKGSY